MVLVFKEVEVFLPLLLESVVVLLFFGHPGLLEVISQSSFSWKTFINHGLCVVHGRPTITALKLP